MSSISQSPPRRRKRVWRSAPSAYSPKRVAWVFAIAATLLVVGATIVFSQLHKQKAVSPQLNPILSQIGADGG
jgi:hypothetical protein